MSTKGGKKIRTQLAKSVSNANNFFSNIGCVYIATYGILLGGRFFQSLSYQERVCSWVCCGWHSGRKPFVINIGHCRLRASAKFRLHPNQNENSWCYTMHAYVFITVYYLLPYCDILTLWYHQFDSYVKRIISLCFDRNCLRRVLAFCLF